MSLPLRSLSYVSRAARALDEDALYALAAQAGRANALDGVTGILVYNGTRFFQTIEGVSGAIEELFGRISRDPRHDKIVVTRDVMIERRSFGSWNLRVLRLLPDEHDAIPERVLAHMCESDPDGLFRAA